MQGQAEHFDGRGRSLARLAVSAGCICAVCAAGAAVWCGMSDGRLIAHDAHSHARLASFTAHASAVVALAQAGMFLFSLGRDGTLLAHNACVVAGGSGGGAACLLYTSPSPRD